MFKLVNVCWMMIVILLASDITTAYPIHRKLNTTTATSTNSSMDATTSTNAPSICSTYKTCYNCIKMNE